MKQRTVNGRACTFDLLEGNGDGGLVIETSVPNGGDTLIFRHWYQSPSQAQGLYDAIDLPAGEADATARVNRALDLGGVSTGGAGLRAR